MWRGSASRFIAPLAFLVVVATAACVVLGLVLAGRADDSLENANRKSLRGAIEALQVLSPDVSRLDPALIRALERASGLEPGPERSRLLTVTFVGGGFTGVEGFAELLSLATALLKSYPGLTVSDLGFHLIEAQHRILPEVTDGRDPVGERMVRPIAAMMRWGEQRKQFHVLNR